MAVYLHCPNCKSTQKTSTRVCGKCKHKFGNRGRKYRVVVSAGGKRKSKISPNLEVAQKLDAKWKGQVVEGDYDLIKKEAPTLKYIWSKFLPWARGNKKTWYCDEKMYAKHLRPYLANKKLDQISAFDVEKLMLMMRKSKSQHGKPYAPATIKHIIVLLSRLYSLAYKWGLHDGDNPCKKVAIPPLNNQVTEFLSNEELNRLLETLDNWPNRMSSSFVLFLLYTGMRRGELFKLKWADVDSKRQSIVLRDPKGKKDVQLPLSDKAIDILNKVPKEVNTEFIFYGKNGQKRTDFKGSWHRIREEANLPDKFRLHGLRHHFASQLVSNGVPLHTVSKLLTHKDIKTTMRYAHLTDSALRDAVKQSDKLNSPKNLNATPTAKLVSMV
jgi:integrase